jgi:hypothetical protein
VARFGRPGSRAILQRVFVAAIMTRRPDASVAPMNGLANVETLYRSLLACWNERDAAGYGALFTTDGSLVGYDGSSVELASVFQ